jgi:hypothetical protein
MITTQRDLIEFMRFTPPSTLVVSPTHERLSIAAADLLPETHLPESVDCLGGTIQYVNSLRMECELLRVPFQHR